MSGLVSPAKNNLFICPQLLGVGLDLKAGATNDSVSPVENNPFTNHSCPQLLGVGLDLKRKLGNISHYHTTPLPASYCFQLLANTHLLVSLVILSE